MESIITSFVLLVGCGDMDFGSLVIFFEPSGKPVHTFYRNAVSIRNKFNWAHWVIPIHEKERCVAGRPVDLVVQAEFDRRQLIVPVLKFALLVYCASEHLFDNCIEALDLALSLRVVGSRKAEGCACNSPESFPELGSKSGVSI